MQRGSGEDYDDSDDIESLDARTERSREDDGVSALHDTEAESGDEELLDDVYSVDSREARELGVNLDDSGPDEPRLD